MLNGLKELLNRDAGRGKSGIIAALETEILAENQAEILARRTKALEVIAEVNITQEKELPLLDEKIQDCKEAVKKAAAALGVAQAELNAATKSRLEFNATCDWKINQQNLILRETYDPAIDSFIDEMTRYRDHIIGHQEDEVPVKKSSLYGDEKLFDGDHRERVSRSNRLLLAIRKAGELKTTHTGDVTAVLSDLRSMVDAVDSSHATVDLV